MATQKQEKCESCRFWQMTTPKDPEEENSVAVGICRRYAPQPTPRLSRHIRVGKEEYADCPLWPLTLDAEWCGEWEQCSKRTAKTSRN